MTIDTRPIRRRTVRDKAILLKLSEAEYLQVHNLAESRGLPMSQYVRLALFHPRSAGHVA
jgi:hypothetical protein